MSAIAGLIHFDGRPDAAQDLARMMGPLALLGPDRHGVWQDNAVALGLRQMFLVPEDRHDRQPWQTPDGDLALVAIARLDNRDEVADALGLAAPALRLTSDSELLFQAYARWGSTCLDRLLGEFSIAAWHRRERRLFLARSHLDGPPLYYHRSPRLFAFATTAGALFALPEIPRVLDERLIALHLALMPRQTGETFYRDVACLPPGHALTVTPDRMTRERYWRLDITRRLTLAKDSDYVEGLRERFDAAVRARLRSVGAVGAHLSSGLDSSAVTATASRLMAEAGGTLFAFTAAPREAYDGTGLDGRPADESAAAAAVAKTLPAVQQVVVRSKGKTPLDGLDRASLLYGVPLVNAENAVWLEGILDAARERRVRVMLNGSMGNMSISYHGLPRLAALARTGHWPALAHEAMALRHAGMGVNAIFHWSLAPFLPVSVWRRYTEWRGRSIAQLADYSAINPAFADEIGLARISRERDWDPSFRRPRDGREMRRRVVEWIDSGDYRNAWLAGWRIDSRDPTSDRQLLEFCLAIPEDQYLRDGVVKFLYRRAFAPVLPVATMVARPKGYQAADWHEGLTAARAQVAAELDRFERSPWARRALDLPRMRRLVEEWPTGGWNSRAVVRNYRVVLLRALAVGKFIRYVEGGND